MTLFLDDNEDGSHASRKGSPNRVNGYASVESMGLNIGKFAPIAMLLDLKVVDKYTQTQILSSIDSVRRSKIHPCIDINFLDSQKFREIRMTNTSVYGDNSNPRLLLLIKTCLNSKSPIKAYLVYKDLTKSNNVFPRRQTRKLP